MIFSTPEEVFPRISSAITTTETYDGMSHFCSTFTYTTRFFDFGSIKSGQYQGAKIVTVRSDFMEPACGAGGDTFGVTYQTFLRQGNKLIRLGLLSQDARNKRIFEDALRSLKMEITSDDRYDIPPLRTPEPDISLNGTCLNFSERLSEERDPPTKVIGKDPLYGDLYLAGNYIHAKLPDGTVASYYLLPPQELDFLDGISTDEYACFREPAKREASGTPDLVTDDAAALESDFKVLRKTPHLGNLYVPKMADYSASKNLYNGYKTDYGQYGSRGKDLTPAEAFSKLR